MRILKDQQGVQPPTSAYPRGRIKNNETLINEEINGDIIQFFQKLLIDQNITANGSPDNTYNGYQLVEALDGKIEDFIKTKLQHQNPNNLIKKVIEIGAWDMDANSAINISHGVDFTKIKSISVIIISDSGLSYFPIRKGDMISGLIDGNFWFDSTFITLQRRSGGSFNSAGYDDSVMNRGYITITYEAFY